MNNNVIDIYEYIQKDHDSFIKLLAYFEACNDEDEQMLIIDKLNNELILHAESAEGTFYKTLEEHKEGIDAALTGEQDHADIEEKIVEIKSLNAPTVIWRKKINELKELIQRHISAEEGSIFPIAKQLISQEDAINLKKEIISHKNRMRRVIQYIPISFAKAKCNG